MPAVQRVVEGMVVVALMVAEGVVVVALMVVEGVVVATARLAVAALLAGMPEKMKKVPMAARPARPARPATHLSPAAGLATTDGSKNPRCLATCECPLTGSPGAWPTIATTLQGVSRGTAPSSVAPATRTLGLIRDHFYVLIAYHLLPL